MLCCQRETSDLQKLAQDWLKNLEKMQKGSSAELSEKSEKPCPVGSRCPRKHPSHCPVCGVERDQGFKGRFCSHCVASCNSLFNHQRVAEILGCERCKKVVVKDSQARRAKQPKISKQTGVSKKILKSMTQHLGQVVQCIQDINAQQDLERGRVNGSKKRTAK